MDTYKSRLMAVVCLATLVIMFVLSDLRAGHAAPTQDVIVTNSNKRPVPTSEIPQQPFQLTLYPVIPDGQFNTTGFFKPPAGKRLVIEFASAAASVPATQNMFFEIETTVNGNTAHHRLIAVCQGLLPGGITRDFVVSQPMRVYADPETEVEFFAGRNGFQGSVDLNLTFSGYLVDVP